MEVELSYNQSVNRFTPYVGGGESSILTVLYIYSLFSPTPRVFIGSLYSEEVVTNVMYRRTVLIRRDIFPLSWSQTSHRCSYRATADPV